MKNLPLATPPTSKARRQRHTRTIAEIAGALVLLSGGAAAASTLHSASGGQSGGVIRACASTRTGALSVPVKGTKCPRGTKALSWNSALLGTSTSRATAASGGGDFCTIGQIILTAGKESGPDTIPADGQLLSISSYAALSSLLGTDYGGNGTTTFRLPDLRDAAPNGLTYSICVFGTFP